MSSQAMTFRNAGVATKLEEARFTYQMSGPRQPAKPGVQRQNKQGRDETVHFFPPQHNRRTTDYAATQCCNQPTNIVSISSYDLDTFSSRQLARNVTGPKKTTRVIFGQSENA
jgi:hypothetical protein